MAGPYDVVVIGAGAAGIAAGRALARARCSFLVIEARERCGGRAHTIAREGMALDLGCGWLHAAERNLWRALAEQAGFEIDATPAPWERRSQAEQGDRARFAEAFAAFSARIERAADEPDKPAAAYLAPGDPANDMIDAVCTYLNGVRLDQVSAHDYVRYDGEGGNRRIVAGYGALIAAFGAQIPLALGTPATHVEHGGALARIATARGTLEARCVIVAAPTPLIAAEALRFAPALPAALEAAAGLPLGVVDKMFIACPRDLEAHGYEFGRPATVDHAVYDFRPMGRPVIEAFIAGPLAADLERAGRPAAEAFVIDELAGLLGSAARARLKPLAGSAWGRDPFAQGSYSYARPGFAGARAALAQPFAERIFFAGEALSPAFFGTAHGAAESGIAAAKLALDHLKRRGAR